MTSISAQSPYTPSASGNASVAASNVPTVGQTSDAALSAAAVSLASEAGVIATLGGSSAASYTYNATGLFNSLVQAGSAATAPPQGTSATPDASQAALDQAVLGSLSSASTSSSALYSASGGLQAPTLDVSATFAGILKTNPGFAATAISDSFDQGIIGSISTFA